MLCCSKETGLEANTKKTKYMFVSFHQKAGQKFNVKNNTRAFESVFRIQMSGNSTNKSKLHARIK